jgi:hypothetical protein
MKLSEAERRAKSNLYNLEVNTALLESEKDLLKMIRERGSRVEQRYGEKPGKVSAHYVETVPQWLFEIENLERAVWELIDAATTAQGLLKFCQDQDPELHGFYKAKYKDKLPIPELKARFGTETNKLDRELVFNLIRWHGWSIDEDGGEKYWRWMKKREG